MRMHDMQSLARNVAKINRENRFFVLTLFLLWSVSYAALFISDRTYVDDIGRVLLNYDDWTRIGRPVADLLSKILFLGFPYDVSPVSQLLALAVYAETALLLVAVFRKDISKKTMLYALPIAINPYILENMSYKFDSPWMALSLLLAILPFYIVSVCTSNRSKVFFSTVSLIASLCLYQASYNAFFVVFVFYFYMLLVDRAPVRNAFAVLVSSTVLSVLFYKVILGFIELPEYCVTYGTFFGGRELLQGALGNVLAMYSILNLDWSQNSIGIVFLLAAAFFVLSRLACLRRFTGRGALLVVLALALIPLSFISSYGFQLLLKNPHWMPRTFISISIIPTLVLLCIHDGNKYFRSVTIGLALLLSIQFGLLASGYGNALGEQQRYENLIISPLLHDIGTVAKTHPIDNVVFDRSIGQTPAIANLAKRYPIIKKLTQVYLNGQWVWGGMYLNMESRTIRSFANKKIDAMNAQTVLSESNYSLKLSGKTLIVSFEHDIN